MASPDTGTDFEERLRRIEDHIALNQIVNSYGPSLDSLNFAEAWEDWSEDCSYVISGRPEPFMGHEGLQAMAESAAVADMYAKGACHVLSSPTLKIDGDVATGMNYSVLFMPASGDIRFEAARVAICLWNFVRRDGRWLVVKRVNQLFDDSGSVAARDLARQFLAIRK